MSTPLFVVRLIHDWQEGRIIAQLSDGRWCRLRGNSDYGRLVARWFDRNEQVDPDMAAKVGFTLTWTP